MYYHHHHIITIIVIIIIIINLLNQKSVHSATHANHSQSNRAGLDLLEPAGEPLLSVSLAIDMDLLCRTAATQYKTEVTDSITRTGHDN